MNGASSQYRRAQSRGLDFAKSPFSLILLSLSLGACATTRKAGDLVQARHAETEPYHASAAAMRAHMNFLASDLLQGREPGTPGYDVAAAYVATQFELMGVKPAGVADSYLQPVSLARYGATGPQKLVVRQLDGKRVELVEGKEFGFRGWPAHLKATLAAPLAFAGYGIVAPELGRDDFAGLDLVGKVVILLDGVPPGLTGDSATRFRSPAAKREEAEKRGAVGVITIVDLNPTAPGSTRQGTGSALNASPAQPVVHTMTTTWRAPDGRVNFPTPNVAAVARVNLPGAVKLLAGAPITIEQIRVAAITPGGVIAGFALPGTIEADLRTTVADIPSANVVGMIEGSDPAMRNQVVILSAHLDHLGHLPAVAGDTIANGALDNASGVATLLETARGLIAMPPRRSVLLLAVTAEEQGLVGSDYFVHQPTVPTSSLVADVNLDMPILTYAFEDVVALGGERSTLGAAVDRAAARIGVRVTSATAADQALFSRSDQYSFATIGVPSIFLRTGPANGGEKATAAFENSCYHAVCDDMLQTIDFGAAARFAQVNYEIARELANSRDRPQMKPDVSVVSK